MLANNCAVANAHIMTNPTHKHHAHIDTGAMANCDGGTIAIAQSYDESTGKATCNTNTNTKPHLLVVDDTNNKSIDRIEVEYIAQLHTDTGTHITATTDNKTRR